MLASLSILALFLSLLAGTPVSHASAVHGAIASHQGTAGVRPDDGGGSIPGH